MQQLIKTVRMKENVTRNFRKVQIVGPQFY